jgi:hypothetical protein
VKNRIGELAMTNRVRRYVRLLTPFSLILTGLAGCSQQPSHAETVQAADPPAAVIAPQPVAAAAPGKPQPNPKAGPAEPPVPPAFPFPPDLAGKAVAKTVTPNVAKPLAVKRAGDKPLPRAAPAKLLDPEPVARTRFAPPPLLPAKATGLKPAAPKERVPLDLGAGTPRPERPTLPVSAVFTPRARDVNLPPPAPALGRPAPDRVPFDDPTNDFGNAEVVSSSVKVPLAPSGFLKLSVPDPFELGAQVRPKVPPTAEPSAAPVPVNPRRVK